MPKHQVAAVGRGLPQPRQVGRLGLGGVDRGRGLVLPGGGLLELSPGGGNGLGGTQGQLGGGGAHHQGGGRLGRKTPIVLGAAGRGVGGRGHLLARHQQLLPLLLELELGGGIVREPLLVAVGHARTLGIHWRLGKLVGLLPLLLLQLLPLHGQQLLLLVLLPLLLLLLPHARLG